MKAGGVVTYWRHGKPADATISVVSGSGPSGFKVLDLMVDGKPVAGVMHENDAGGKRAAYWTDWQGGAHAAPDAAHEDMSGPSAVPESTDKGRATAGGSGTRGRKTT